MKKNLLFSCLVFLTFCLFAAKSALPDDNRFDIEKFLSKESQENSKGTTPISLETIRVKSGKGDAGGKNCIFPIPQNSSPASRTLFRKLNSYFIYTDANDPDFNKGDDQYYDASDYYVYSRSYITMNTSDCLSGIVIGEAYTGGAHPIHENLTFLIRSDTGEEVSIRDLIKEDGFKELMSMVYKSYLANYYINSGYESVEEDVRLRKESLFSVKKNSKDFAAFFKHIFVSRNYLYVYIPRYEFGAYYEGDCYVPVGLDKLNAVLTPLGRKLLIVK